MSYDKSFHDDNEVFSISRPCVVGKIKNDKRIRKKNVAKTTIMNIATIIKIKIPVVFTLTILKLLGNKALNRSCVCAIYSKIVVGKSHYFVGKK
jgi:hypothetical protein